VNGEPLRILIYEHVSGGGYAGEPIPNRLLCEGFGMLRSVVSDFKAAGHNITVMLDSRLSALKPPLDSDNLVTITSKGAIETALKKISDHADAFYVIAPEQNQVLQSIVNWVERKGLLSLNCLSSGIEKAANKSNLFERAEKLGLETPKTRLFSLLENTDKITSVVNDEIGFPMVVKPVSGSGCGGLSLVKHPCEIENAIGKVKRDVACECFMVQELIDGVAASVTLFSSGSKAVPVSLNQQDVILGPPGSASNYFGGAVPLVSPLREDAFASAKQLVESCGDLRGYVGVDLVLKANAAFVVDINPRLTTSYVGLRKVACFNLAEALLDAVLKSKVPKDAGTLGYSCFSKVSVPNPSVAALQKSFSIPEVVSPPFILEDENNALALVESHGATIQDAMFKTSEAKKVLRRLFHGGS
jgi:tyramine---L-glutamate ligase